MNSYELWLKSILPVNKKYRVIQCPLLINNKCSIYNERPNCCRQYPRTNGYYCSVGSCMVLVENLSNNTEQSSSACFKCKDICCNHIMVPEGVEITREFLMKWMDIDCTMCKKYF